MEYNVVLIEDERETREEIKQMMKQYSEKRGDALNLSAFPDADAFFSNSGPDFDVIFLDIQMPGMNGMDAARHIRRHNEHVPLVFVTNMAQYAVEGYEVHAYDFILKSLSFESFSMKLDRICKELRHTSNTMYLTLSSRGCDRRICIADILYVEVSNHDLIFHLAKQTFRIRGTMREMEEQLINCHFARCNSCYLVNLRHVQQFSGNTVIVGGHELRISQTKKQAFLLRLAQYSGGSI